MDKFFDDEYNSYITQFKLVSDHDYDAREVINDNDDNIHDQIELEVASKVRNIEEVRPNLQNESLPNAQSLIQEFTCNFCMGIVNQPTVIKYCLHFFCKECIELYIRNYKKECPLCKNVLKTKRELRRYEKIEAIINLLNPVLEQSQQNEQQEYEDIRQNQIKEQQEMGKIQNERKAQADNKKRTFQEYENNLEDKNKMIEIQEEEEQSNIRRKVEKLQAMNEKKKQIKNKYFKVGEDERETIALTKDDLEYHKDYQQFLKQVKEQYPNDSLEELGIPFSPPELNMKVKVLFDEDFKNLLFPKIRELVIRVNENYTLEVLAKTLASKNLHPDHWDCYEFSYMTKESEQGQYSDKQLKDMDIKFTELKKEHDQSELLLFYKILDLELLKRQIEEEEENKDVEMTT